MKTFMCAVVLVMTALFSQPALAHKVVMDVFVDGDVIEGELGFSSGDMTPGVTVGVFDKDDKKIADVVTDSEGAFTYKPTKRMPYFFRANLGAGHVGFAKIDVDDLPTTLGSSAASDAKVGAGSAIDSEALRKMIGKEVGHAIKPLRKEIIAYKEKNNLQTVLGGIGYIVGVFGLVFYIAARRKISQID